MLYKLYQAYKITKEENVIEEKEVLILNYGGFGANLLHKPMHIVIEEIDDECKEEFNNDDIFDNNIDYGYVVTKIEHHRNTDQRPKSRDTKHSQSTYGG
ncbi:hypothetical protein F6Y05_37050 [Bacillus megaterium]|nr:hypothetical protein [Priestia megaterium]